ncbi:hypothetical protein PanWU01x14_215970 [Parasponia andersonii]|uniref:Uncharacterized protein n=1 Tax=Parasponia andersonii TaxID=3476 RepID=A0A2P5BRX7_PARAD|nr:hypothetical protein PanWU01x14_215970 [Parasponia andersonii]
MDQATQGNNNSDASADLVKRKRGRPRKYPKINREDSVRIPNIQKMDREENVGMPPGFGGLNGNQPRQVAATNDTTTDDMVGKAVSGVVEAVFDAGYLLCVRVANSDTTLRGVVFKPGRYVPISRENDVAPNVQMIRRNEIPLSAEHHNARSRERKEQQANTRRDGTHSLNESPAANQVPRAAPYSANHVGSKVSKVLSLPVQTAHLDPVTSRSNLVPVVLQPTNLSGLSLVGEQTPATQSSHLTASKGKQVQEAALPSSGSVSTNQVLTVGSREVLSQPQISQWPMSEEVVQNNKNDYVQPPVEVLLTAEANSMKLPSMPFEKLVSEVIKRIEAPSESAETQMVDNKSADKMLVKDGDKINNVNQALAIEPLQAVQVGDNKGTSSALKPMEDDKTRNMSRLLEGNATESQVNPIAESASTQMLSRMPSHATKSKDKEISNLKQGP